MSVTFVYFIKTAEDIVKLLSRPVSPIILVSDPDRAPVPNSKGQRKIHGVGKVCDFRLKSPFITVRDSSQLLWNVNRKSHVADRYVSVQTTLSDLERRDMMVNFFSGVSPE